MGKEKTVPTLGSILEDSIQWRSNDDMAYTKIIEKIVDEIKTMTGQNLVINRAKEWYMLYVVTDMDPLFPIVGDSAALSNKAYPIDVNVNDDATEILTHVEWVRHYGLEAKRIIPLLTAYRDGVAAGYQAREMDEDRDRSRHNSNGQLSEPLPMRLEP